ncbi:MAG: hypothetical protein OEV73_11585 [Desulfobulbaceae bacterium]|nr:hypothetical protein [Desulfobulbaceae bacterium]
MKKSIISICLGGILLPILLTSTPALSRTCLNGKCHQALTTARHLHGPIAAEMAGAKGCIACHLANGPACTKKRAGKFVLAKQEKELCKLCHGKGTATVHTDTQTECLRCHDPHGSDKGPNLLRTDPVKP